MEILLTVAASIAVGIVVGMLSGLLGVGGGTVLVPIFKLMYGMPAIAATATSLFTIIPTSASGLVTHLRNKTCIPALGVAAGIGGACTSPVGVWLASLSPDWAIMVAAALVIGYSAVTMFRKAMGLWRKQRSQRAAEGVSGCAESAGGARSRAVRAHTNVARAEVSRAHSLHELAPHNSEPVPIDGADWSEGNPNNDAGAPGQGVQGREANSCERPWLEPNLRGLETPAPERKDGAVFSGKRLVAVGAAIGVGAGVVSGYVGVGGGFIMVPLFMQILRTPMKLTSGTSLIAVMILAIPATITQAVLGNVDWLAGVFIALGTIPGAAIGSKLITRVPELALRFTFGAFLLVAAVLLVLNQAGIF